MSFDVNGVEPLGSFGIMLFNYLISGENASTCQPSWHHLSEVKEFVSDTHCFTKYYATVYD
jgi:hypothetical protein